MIRIEGARVHNLKSITVEIPRDKLVVITGLSGSGKSSLAFDTLYAEGQRRYVESLSAYARQFLGQMEKPDVDHIEGLSPAISIEQRTASGNPRSTVGTVTEIYDYLRLLFARVGIPHCYRCGKPISRQSVGQMVSHVLGLPKGTRIRVLAPLVRGRKGEHRAVLERASRDGYVRVRIDGDTHDLDFPIGLKKTRKHDIEVVVDRLVVGPGIEKRLSDSMETAIGVGGGIVIVEVGGERDVIFSQTMACADCGISVEELSPRAFSFNSPYGACPECKGLGDCFEIDPSLVVTDPALSLREGAIPLGKSGLGDWAGRKLKALKQDFSIDPDRPFRNLPAKARNLVLYGPDEKQQAQLVKRRRKRSLRWEGMVPWLQRRYCETQSEAVRQWIHGFMNEMPCPGCGGARLRPESLAVRLGNLNISELTQRTVKGCRGFFDDLDLPSRDRKIASQILKEINDRLAFLSDVGLEYLTLDRQAGTLSGGEAQRIRLATQIGASLVGVLYILDEPSIGLHHRDNHRLLRTLKRLRDQGNSVLVVEHDRDTILESDWVLDLGPGAGRMGGRVVASGTPADLEAVPESLTGAYLSGRKQIPIRSARRKGNGKQLTVKAAEEHNLKAIDVGFPMGTFICVTGVSGSGKSTLVHDILYRALSRLFYRSREVPGKHGGIEGLSHIDKVIEINQSPIGRTPRSNAATYTGAFTAIRDLYSTLPEARIRGYKRGRFSFNVKGGRCEICGGDGVMRIEMHFLPDVYVRCDVCKGRRYNRETLEVAFKGKNIADVLEMTISEALAFLRNIPTVRPKLETLERVGLGYLRLGQSATTLSGGEAQRVKLAAELSKRSTGRTLYILDEPTTGLHFEDTRLLLSVLDGLVEMGNTVVVIEHNLDVIKTADYIIDLGPEGGDDGGWVVAAGTPEEVSRVGESHTGRVLAEVLKKD
ncbi:MAG: excinuclease ABC subunit UvrA [Candidatus Eisenbacteria sp.]|nr:excinuclease ABC subunit UvrA [Candidatus Eisenbacteria bacterium]